VAVGKKGKIDFNHEWIRKWKLGVRRRVSEQEITDGAEKKSRLFSVASCEESQFGRNEGKEKRKERDSDLRI
jgi:hypothetical protein